MDGSTNKWWSMFNDFHMLRFNVLVSFDWQNHSTHSQLNSTPCSMVLPCSTHMNILMVFCWLWGRYTFSHRKPLVTPGILARLKAQRLSPSNVEMFVSLLWWLVRKTCILCRKKNLCCDMLMPKPPSLHRLSLTFLMRLSGKEPIGLVWQPQR